MTIDLESYQKTNMILWIAILCGVVLMTVIALIMDKMQLFPADYDFPVVTEGLFIMAVILAVAILILKRTYFRVDKVVERCSGLTDISEKVNYVLNELRRNYLILWAEAEAIGCLGFVYFVLTGNLQNFLLFTLVSIFSLCSNFPARSTVKLFLDSLGYYGPTHA